jgi:predicted lipoprotein with Yx(FWY)xxD motif
MLGALAALAALGVAVAAFAAAATATLKIGTAESAVLQKRVAVNAQGRTLYELSPETTRHLLCRSATCLGFWPPLTVPSRTIKVKLGPGLHGKVSLIRRGHAWQVAIGGHPLYRYSGDRARGQANGEGVVSFGGKWHAVTAAAGALAPAPAPPPPPYTYPATATETVPAPPPATTPATPTTTTPKPPPYPQY